MDIGGQTGLTLSDLAEALQSADPSVLLVPPRILRRVIKHDRRLPGIGLQVPHRKTYVCTRAALLACAERDELGMRSAGDLPEVVFLIAQPREETLAVMPRAAALVKYWRLLFHSRVHRAFDQEIEKGKLTQAVLGERVARIGAVEFEEITTVLQQERFLLPPEDPLSIYVEFAAVFLELRYFDPSLLFQYFPGIDSFERIDALLAEDLDAEALFTGTRPAGAADPLDPREETDSNGEITVAGVEHVSPGRPDMAGESRTSVPQPRPPDIEGEPEAARVTTPDPRRLRKAARAAELGNAVRSAILKTQAGATADPGGAGDARADLDQLSRRLQAALRLDDAETESWRQVLPALLGPAAHGIWAPAALLLYDLQKVCVDHERTVYTVDLVEWALSLGQRPIQRPIPGRQEVRALAHLRSARKRLVALEITDSDRRRLAALLNSAIERGEQRLRERFRPLVQGALEEVGLHPQNFPERDASHKLVEEMLDRVSERGFLALGDLRDALSRNQLKLPDLLGDPEELVHGDRLLRCDRRLAVVLDGVYRRGEIYMRILQRLSALAFGTPLGRFLTLYLALPCGGAFIILEGVQYLIEEFVELTGLIARAPDLEAVGDLGEKLGFHLRNVYSFTFLSLFLFALLHVPSFRGLIGKVLAGTFAGVRWLLCGLPSLVLHNPLVCWVLNSRPFRWCRQYFLKPLALAAPLSLILPLLGAGQARWSEGGAILFLAALVLVNTRLGRDLEEAGADWLARTWQQIRVDLVPNLFRFVVGIFKRFLEFMERILYTVDEWIRFRGGDSRWSLAVKAVLGLVWFFVSYVVRFCINLLIEPQINPIKHFPVVTVSHKLLLPLIPHVAETLALTMDKPLAYTVTTTVIFGIPGIFGFLVWELKENWRLYRANRPATLRPVAIGHHGETMLRLLRPGFHSGTLPKLYAKLRRAMRKAQQTGRWRVYRKYQEALHDVEEALCHFVEREFLYLLNGSKCWGPAPVHVGAVHLSTNRIRVELFCPGLSPAPLCLSFTFRSGWLVARVAEPGWLTQLSAPQRQALRLALAGFYKLSGVDLVCEQIAAALEPNRLSFDIAAAGLVVRPEDNPTEEAIYDLDAESPLLPRGAVDSAPSALPTLRSTQVLFRELAIPWDQWVKTWEQDQTEQTLPEAFLEGVRLLPEESREPRAESREPMDPASVKS